jgi:8-oxo-dGTP pyrophosphatase MutT (NUDIX family)
VEDALLRAAGLMVVTPKGEGLFLRYVPEHDHGGEWGFPAGGLEGDEEASDAAIRETREETGWVPNEKVKEIDSSQDEVDFTTFATVTGNQFIPELSDEHDSWCWAPLSNPPDPLHPGVKKTLKSIVDTDEIMDVVGQDRYNASASTKFELANTIKFPPDKSPEASRAISIAYANGGTSGGAVKQSVEANRFINSGGATEKDRERTGRQHASLGSDKTVGTTSGGKHFFDERYATLRQRRRSVGR